MIYRMNILEAVANRDAAVGECFLHDEGWLFGAASLQEVVCGAQAHSLSHALWKR